MDRWRSKFDVYFGSPTQTPTNYSNEIQMESQQSASTSFNETWSRAFYVNDDEYSGVQLSVHPFQYDINLF